MRINVEKYVNYEIFHTLVRYLIPMTRIKRILITGFEAFGGESLNSTQKLLEHLEPPENTDLFKLILPVAFNVCLELLEQAVVDYQPDVVLAFGQAGSRNVISLERVAINVSDASIPDNCGCQPVDSCVIESAPTAYFTRLPLKRMLQNLLDNDLPAEISNSAGTYVCNHLMFGLLHLIQTRYLQVRGGFIHVPFLPEQAAK